MSYDNGDKPNQGIGDYMILILVSIAWSFYTFGFSWKALFAAMLIVNGGIAFVVIVSYLWEKFKN